MIELQDKIRGGMYGKVIGDSLGMPVEGWSAEQIRLFVPGGKGITELIAPFIVRDAEGNILRTDYKGKKLKDYSAHLDKGYMSDDGALTLALDEAIVEAQGYDLTTVARHHVAMVDARSAMDPTGRAAFGKSTLEATDNMRRGVSLDKTATSFGPGNGPAMKGDPIGWTMHVLSRSGSSDAYLEGISFAEKVAKMTHLDPRSIVSGVIQAHLAYSIMWEGNTGMSLIHEAQEVAYEYEGKLEAHHLHSDKGTLLDKLNWIARNPLVDDEEAIKVLGNNSLVFRSYPFTLFMLQKYWDRPLEGLLKTVNAGGDCDTTGAMYGSLMGARLGTGAFPKEWRECLEQKDRLERAADGIYKLGGFNSN